MGKLPVQKNASGTSFVTRATLSTLCRDVYTHLHYFGSAAALDGSAAARSRGPTTTSATAVA